MCRVACHALPSWFDTHDIAQEFQQCRVTDSAYLLASRRQGTEVFYQTAPQASPPEGGHKNVLAHANCTLFCAPNARKRTGSQQG